jgi:hypothetical protein
MLFCSVVFTIIDYLLLCFIHSGAPFIITKSQQQQNQAVDIALTCIQKQSH